MKIKDWLIIGGAIGAGVGKIYYDFRKIAKLKQYKEALLWAKCVEVDVEVNPKVKMNYIDRNRVVHSYDELKVLYNDYKFYKKFRKKLNKGMDIEKVKIGEINRWNDVLNKYGISDTRICFC